MRFLELWGLAALPAKTTTMGPHLSWLLLFNHKLFGLLSLLSVRV